MAKKQYVSLKGKALGDVVVPDKHPGGKISKIGLSPNIVPKKYAHRCHHYTLEKLKREGNLYRCMNPMCRKLLIGTLKKVKKEKQ